MSFMVPEIFESEFYEVEYDSGSTAYIPLDVTSAVLNSDLRDYVEGTLDDPDEPVVVKNGWLCRLQAPGYCDATDWSAFDTEREAIEFMLEFYGNDDGDFEGWEIGLELRKLELDGLGRFECVECFNGYNVRDRITGESHGMSDGVDMFVSDDEDVSTPAIGTEEFRALWEALLNEDPDETLEAYFPDQYEREND